MTPRVREILSWYGAENIGVLTNLARLFQTGRLKGAGKIVLSSFDEGGRGGTPLERFSSNPDSYDPHYHIELAILAGCSGLVAPLGALEAVLRSYAGDLPCLLKITSVTEGSVVDRWTPIKAAQQLGCIGIVIDFPFDTVQNKLLGTSHHRDLIGAAKDHGLVVMGCLRWVGEGEGVKGESEWKTFSSIESVSEGAFQMAQWGVHILSLPVPHDDNLSESYRAQVQHSGLRSGVIADRSRHVIHSAMNGHRIVVYHDDFMRDKENLVVEFNDLAKGGAFGGHFGVNAFKRPKPEAIDILGEVMDAFGGYNTGRNMR